MKKISIIFTVLTSLWLLSGCQSAPSENALRDEIRALPEQIREAGRRAEQDPSDKNVEAFRILLARVIELEKQQSAAGKGGHHAP